MKVVIESIIVGLYTYFISIMVNTKDPFLIGFIKHFVGGIIGLHKYYCGIDFNFSLIMLIVESIFEGLIFKLMFSTIFEKESKYHYFFTGFLLHLVFDILNLHNIFCKLHRNVNINLLL
jgi:LytS/YehU family sensor histidine kinase